MKEKRIGQNIILIAFVIIICLSKGIWFFTEKVLDSENYENRQLATQPRLTLDSYSTFSADYTSYFNDNLQFRNYLISLNSGIDYFCFGKSSNESVILGKENWLFYSCPGESDPISCYQGKNLYSDEELAVIAQNCINQRDFVESQGKEFAIFIAPNKERVYSEYMPDRYGKPADNYRVLQIYNYLKANTDIRIIYPYDELMEAKSKLSKNIYSKTDTHWNYLGGYIGATALLKDLGIEMPSIYGDDITINVGSNYSGDLADMLGLGKQLSNIDTEYSISGYDLHDSECTGWDFFGMWSYQAKNADPRCLYIIRDSFSTHMAGYLGSQFSNTYLRHVNSYSYEDLCACNPDIVVFELVEREADRLATFSIQ